MTLSNNFNIKYPLINKRIPGIKDINIIVVIGLSQFNGCQEYKPKDSYISGISKVDEQPVLNIVLQIGSLQIPFNAKLNTLEKIRIPNDASDIVTYDYITIQYYIEAEESIFNRELDSLLGISFSSKEGVFEPCCIIWKFDYNTYMSDIFIDKSKNVITPPSKVIFNNGLTLEKISDNEYTLIGENPRLSINNSQGINSINGVSRKSLDLSVSDSLLLEPNYSNHSITIRFKNE